MRARDLLGPAHIILVVMVPHRARDDVHARLLTDSIHWPDFVLLAQARSRILERYIRPALLVDVTLPTKLCDLSAVLLCLNPPVHHAAKERRDERHDPGKDRELLLPRAAEVFPRLVLVLLFLLVLRNSFVTSYPCGVFIVGERCIQCLPASMRMP